MTAADLAARVRRLDQLSRGLALEISNVSKPEDPMLYLERRATFLESAAVKTCLAG